MKDMTGREIQVGDRIVYASNPYGEPVLTEGTVIEVDADSAKIARHNVGGGYSSILHGVRKINDWRAGGMIDDPRSQKICPTRIGYSSRCFITSR